MAVIGCTMWHRKPLNANKPIYLYMIHVCQCWRVQKPVQWLELIKLHEQKQILMSLFCMTFFKFPITNITFENWKSQLSCFFKRFSFLVIDFKPFCICSAEVQNTVHSVSIQYSYEGAEGLMLGKQLICNAVVSIDCQDNTFWVATEINYRTETLHAPVGRVTWHSSY